jgi:hypothetical protein
LLYFALFLDSITANGFALDEAADLPADRKGSTKLAASTELDTKRNASFKHPNRFFAKCLLSPVILFIFNMFLLVK